MIDDIRAKMKDHIAAILEKPIITNEEYMILNGFLAKLEAEQMQEKLDKERGESDKRLKALMEFTMGGFTHE